MYEIIFLVLALGLMAFVSWWLKRRRRELLGDADAPARDAGLPDEPLTRDALIDRQREFDPSGWDDSPDPSATPARPAPARPAPARPATPSPAAEGEDEAPVYFDRAFLERRQRERATDDTEPDTPPAD